MNFITELVAWYLIARGTLFVTLTAGSTGQNDGNTCLSIGSVWQNDEQAEFHRILLGSLQQMDAWRGDNHKLSVHAIFLFTHALLGILCLSRLGSDLRNQASRGSVRLKRSVRSVHANI